jgi:hypothetical protein
MNEKSQNFKNHMQLVPSYHFVTLAILLMLLIGAIYNITVSTEPTRLFAWLFLLLVFAVVSVALHSRTFALKVQDRAIRAEENFRYFILTNKRLPQNITIHQLIALRFASDEELAELVEKTVKEKLSPKDIKQSIKNWKADHHRA